MSINSAVGIESGEDSYATGVNATQSAIEKLEGEPRSVIVFASSEYDQQKVVEGVRSVVPDALLTGCSTAGEITHDGPAKRGSVAVMVLNGDDVRFYGGVGEGVAEDEKEAGRRVAGIVKDQAGDDDLRSFMMFPDVLAGNGADIVRGVLEVLGDHFPVVGGAAGDDFKFEKTYQYFNDQVYSGTVVGLGLAGDFKIGIGVKHGWTPVGPSMKVTRSEGAVLHELDGKPAVEIYKDYFGEEEAEELKSEPLAKMAITYPLGIKAEDSEEMMIRDPITVNEEGSITCAAEVPEGSDVRLMIGSKEEAITVAREAARNAREQLDGEEPKAIIIFNCIARNKLFGDDSGDEISAIQEELGQNTPLLGFYTYGEQAPIGGEVKNVERCNPAFHNETVVIVALS